VEEHLRELIRVSPILVSRAQCLAKLREGGWKAHCRIKQATTDTEKSPDVDQQAESVDQRCVYILLVVESSVLLRTAARLGVQHDLTCKGEVQEHKGPDKLAGRGNEVSLEGAELRTRFRVGVEGLLRFRVDREAWHGSWIVRLWRCVAHAVAEESQ
jgi:hypothetical protein